MKDKQMGLPPPISGVLFFASCWFIGCLVYLGRMISRLISKVVVLLAPNLCGSVVLLQEERGTVVVFTTPESETFRIFIPKIRASYKVHPISVRDQDHNDVYDRVLQYMGPNLEFYCHLPTPKDLGYDQLTFTYPEGHRLIFKGEQPLVVTQRG
jgi:hypothetical protein